MLGKDRDTPAAIVIDKGAGKATGLVRGISYISYADLSQSHRGHRLARPGRAPRQRNPARGAEATRHFVSLHKGIRYRRRQDHPHASCAATWWRSPLRTLPTSVEPATVDRSG